MRSCHRGTLSSLLSSLSLKKFPCSSPRCKLLLCVHRLQLSSERNSSANLQCYRQLWLSLLLPASAPDTCCRGQDPCHAAMSKSCTAEKQMVAYDSPEGQRQGHVGHKMRAWGDGCWGDALFGFLLVTDLLQGQIAHQGREVIMCIHKLCCASGNKIDDALRLKFFPAWVVHQADRDWLRSVLRGRLQWPAPHLPPLPLCDEFG